MLNVWMQLLVTKLLQSHWNSIPEFQIKIRQSNTAANHKAHRLIIISCSRYGIQHISPQHCPWITYENYVWELISGGSCTRIPQGHTAPCRSVSRKHQNENLSGPLKQRMPYIGQGTKTDDISILSLFHPDWYHILGNSNINMYKPLPLQHDRYGMVCSTAIARVGHISAWISLNFLRFRKI